eukprot:scaffold46031_cov27-Tisochrysis_lutea.AAC.3
MTRLLSALHAECPRRGAGAAPDGDNEYHLPADSEVKWNAWTSFMPTRLDDWPPKMTMPLGSVSTNGSGSSVDVWRMRVGGGAPELETPDVGTLIALVAMVMICQLGVVRSSPSFQTVWVVSGESGPTVSPTEAEPP